MGGAHRLADELRGGGAVPSIGFCEAEDSRRWTRSARGGHRVSRSPPRRRFRGITGIWDSVIAAWAELGRSVGEVGCMCVDLTAHYLSISRPKLSPSPCRRPAAAGQCAAGALRSAGNAIWSLRRLRARAGRKGTGSHYWACPQPLISTPCHHKRSPSMLTADSRVVHSPLPWGPRHRRSRDLTVTARGSLTTFVSLLSSLVGSRGLISDTA
ncbi:hypothetical protein GUJ93_ZPchr0009g160 [Zizania palustris]|uniref:Uncharacterized protein n=1 Tax=Zizania palustris TaxID=103762 RepID=A0A8J5RNG3_ZIZPA|nr:hypothetical protein GUJ93_ZPchr0009g160 [Zizania palustris]